MKYKVEGYAGIEIETVKDEHRQTVFERIYVWRGNQCLEPFIDEYGRARYWIEPDKETVQKPVAIAVLLQRRIVENVSTSILQETTPDRLQQKTI